MFLLTYCSLYYQNRVTNSKFSNGVYESLNGVHYFPPAIEDLIEKTNEITFQCPTWVTFFVTRPDPSLA